MLKTLLVVLRPSQSGLVSKKKAHNMNYNTSAA